MGHQQQQHGQPHQRSREAYSLYITHMIGSSEGVAIYLYVYFILVCMHNCYLRAHECVLHYLYIYIYLNPDKNRMLKSSII